MVDPIFRPVFALALRRINVLHLHFLLYRPGFQHYIGHFRRFLIRFFTPLIKSRKKVRSPYYTHFSFNVPVYKLLSPQFRVSQSVHLNFSSPNETTQSAFSFRNGTSVFMNNVRAA